MRVIDGMHRLLAASSRGDKTIEVLLVDGTEEDMFLRAVEENVAHGLPLSRADRRAAAERVIESHPQLSNRAIGRATGLAAKTVALIRERSAEGVPQPDIRLGKDGKAYPLDSSEGRRLAAEFLAQRPHASLRTVAQAAGISPATALDVRRRLERGVPPIPAQSAVTGAGADAGSSLDRVRARSARASRDVSALDPSPSAQRDPASAVGRLLRDPSLRDNDRGKDILRLLHVNAVGAGQLSDSAPTVPAHCVEVVVELARQYASMWTEFADELDGRTVTCSPTG